MRIAMLSRIGGTRCPLWQDFQGAGIDESGVRIEDIYAIQVLAEVCVSHNKNRTTRYNSYELNLVLTGGSRVNVIDHGNREQILEDARTLASFLGVPLWMKD